MGGRMRRSRGDIGAQRALEREGYKYIIISYIAYP